MEFKKLNADISSWENAPRDPDCDEEITYRRSKRTDVAKDAMSFDEYCKRKKQKKQKCSSSSANDGSTCWLCQVPQSAREGTSTGTGRFFRMFSENYKQCNEDDLYTQLHELYMHDVYTPMLKQGHDVPMLTAMEIKEHFLEHVFEPSVYVSEEIKFLKNVATTMKNHIFCEDDKTKNIDVDDKRVWNYLKVQKQIIELYNTRLTSMNFYDPTAAVCRT